MTDSEGNVSFYGPDGEVLNKDAVVHSTWHHKRKRRLTDEESAQRTLYSRFNTEQTRLLAIAEGKKSQVERRKERIASWPAERQEEFRTAQLAENARRRKENSGKMAATSQPFEHELTSSHCTLLSDNYNDRTKAAVRRGKARDEEQGVVRRISSKAATSTMSFNAQDDS